MSSILLEGTGSSASWGRESLGCEFCSKHTFYLWETVSCHTPDCKFSLIFFKSPRILDTPENLDVSCSFYKELDFQGVERTQKRSRRCDWKEHVAAGRYTTGKVNTWLHSMKMQLPWRHKHAQAAQLQATQQPYSWESKHWWFPLKYCLPWFWLTTLKRQANMYGNTIIIFKRQTSLNTKDSSQVYVIVIKKFNLNKSISVLPQGHLRFP